MKKLGFLITSMLCMSSAFAGEALFGRVYTTETMPKGTWEVEQIVRNRRDRSFGNYSAFDFRTEFEYGITDNFQMALYLNTGLMNASGAPDDDDPNGATGFTRNNFFLQGFSLEFIYRVLNPFTDPIGLAFYLEPEIYIYDSHNGLKFSGTFETEYRILVQKNFFDDQLILAFNTILEIEFIRFEGQDSWKGELDWNNEFGATYRFTSNWFAGFEVRNHNEIGNFNTHEHSVFWLGPVVHYGGPSVWATFAALRQVYGNPSGVDQNGTFIGNGLFLRSHELWELTAKVGVPF